MATCINHAKPIRLDKRMKSGPVEICLGAREVLTLNGDPRGSQIVLLKGNIWVTQKGDLKDHVLSPGERFVAMRDGKVLIEGLREARFRLVPGEGK